MIIGILVVCIVLVYSVYFSLPPIRISGDTETTVEGETYIQIHTNVTTEEIPYLRVRISGVGRLLNENGQVLDEKLLQSKSIFERSVEEWQFDVSVTISSNFINWNTLEVKLVSYIKDPTTGQTEELESGHPISPRRERYVDKYLINSTTVEITNGGMSDLVTNALDKLDSDISAPLKIEFLFTVILKVNDLTGKPVDDDFPPSGKPDVKTILGFSTTLHKSWFSWGKSIVDAPLEEIKQ